MKRKFVKLFEHWKSEFESNSLNEAFLDRDVDRALDLMSSYLTNALGETVIHDKKVEHIKQNGNTEYKGVRFVSLSGNVWRLNWIPSEIKDSSAISNVDFWFSDNPTPDYKVDTSKMNSVQILAMIVHVIKTKGFKVNPEEFIKSTFNIDIPIQESKISKNQMSLFESLSDEEKMQYDALKLKWYNRKKKPNAMTDEEAQKFVFLEVKKLGFEDIANDRFGVVEVEDEENIDPEEVAQVERLKSRLESEDGDVAQLFKDLDHLVVSVIRGLDNSLIITGSAGVGKTTAVKKNMEKFGLEKGRDWRLIKGKSTALGLYRTFYHHRDDTILVFDDCDSVFRTEDSRNLLKAALDTEDVREVTWLSSNTFNPAGMSEVDIHKMLQKGKIPQYFEMTSRVIFVTNITRDEILSEKKMAAIVSRSKSIDITLSDDQMLEHIEKLLPNLDVELDEDEKLEVLEVMKTSVKAGVIKTEINIRTYLGMCKAKILSLYFPEDDADNFDWVRLATKYS